MLDLTLRKERWTKNEGDVKVTRILQSCWWRVKVMVKADDESKHWVLMKEVE